MYWQIKGFFYMIRLEPSSNVIIFLSRLSHVVRNNVLRQILFCAGIWNFFPCDRSRKTFACRHGSLDTVWFCVVLVLSRDIADFAVVFWWNGCGRTLYSLSSCILYCDRWVLSWSHLSSLLYPVKQSHTGMSSTIYFQTTSKRSNFVVTHTSHPWSASFRCLYMFIVFPHEIQTLWFCGCPLFTCLFFLFVCMYACIHIYIYTCI